MSLLSLRSARPGFIVPCLPTRTAHPPLGPGWLHEIKYDGFRVMARRDGHSVRLLTRRGYDWTQRFRLIADAVARLRCQSCLIDGEAVACDDGGVPDFKCSFAIAGTARPNSTALISWNSTARTCGASPSRRARLRSSDC